MAQGIALQLGSVAMMLAAVWFYLSGTMILANALMVVIMSFLVFAQISSAGSGHVPAAYRQQLHGPCR